MEPDLESRIPITDGFDIEIHKKEIWRNCTKSLSDNEKITLTNLYFAKYWIHIRDEWYLVDNDGKIVGGGHSKAEMSSILHASPFGLTNCRTYLDFYFGPIKDMCGYYPRFKPNYDMDNRTKLDESELASIGKFISHYRNEVCGGNDDHFKYLMEYFGRKFHTPFDTHLYPVCLVLYGPQGSGKSTPIFDLFSKAFPIEYIGKPKSFKTMLSSIHNGESRFNLISIIDEVPDCASKDKSIEWDEFKSLVTEKIRMLRAMHRDGEKIKNYVSYILTTDNYNSIKCQNGDRRFFMLKLSGNHCSDKKYFSDLLREIEEKYELIIRFCMSMIDDPKSAMGDPPMTEWKDYSIKYNLCLVGQALKHHLLDQGTNFLSGKVHKTQMAQMVKEWCSESKVTKVMTNQEIYKQLVQYLPPTIRSGSQDVYHVENDQWESVFKKLSIGESERLRILNLI